MVNASNLSSKIGYFLAGAAVGVIVEASSIYQAFRNQNFRNKSSTITTIPSSNTASTQYQQPHPSDLNCSEMERGIRASRSSTPQIPSGCEFYTNPFWQYVCATPEQYERVNSYYRWREQLDLLRQWHKYRKCEQNDRQL